MVKENLSGPTVTTTRASSDTVSAMAKERERTKTAVTIKVTMKKTNPQGKAYTDGRTEKVTRVSGKTASSTGKE